jgi:hypothetical protein
MVPNMRIEQPEGTRGSLKWIQRAVNEQWPSLNQPIVDHLGVDLESLSWLSPLAEDRFAEYRDGAFLERIGQTALADALQGFWPTRGPQWDALGKVAERDVLLIEAKAHIAEPCSPGPAAGDASRARIEASLAATADHLGARLGRAAWSDHFYQIANRLSHLHFLRRHGVRAWLILVNFVGDREMAGPTTSEAWEAAYEVAFHVMGLPKKHLLSSFVLHVYPTVQTS